MNYIRSKPLSNTMSEELSIEIGCAPGFTRPDTHFKNMCESCNADPEWFECTSKLFGDWKWDLKRQYEKEYLAIRPDVQRFLSNLYNMGCIRYASW